MKAAFITLSVIVSLLIPGPAHAQAAAAVPGIGAVLPRDRSLGPYQRSSIEGLLRGTSVPVDSLNVIVFLVSFADRDFNANHGMAYFENELRHLKEYYLGASRDIFSLRTTIHPVTVELSGNEGYYGEDDLWKERMAELLIELVQKTDAAVDFSRYDAYAVIHAGAGQETDFKNDSRYQISSGFVNPDEMAEALKDTLGTPGVPTNDLLNGDTLQIDNLMVWPEESSQDGEVLGSLGIYAYQVGLRLGMVPLFDSTPDGFPDSQGIGSFDLMSYGIYNAIGFVPAFPSAFNRYLMGWVEPIVVEDDRTVRIADVNSTGTIDTTLVKIPINASEYFLIENRVHDANFNGKFDFTDLNYDGIPDNPDTLRGAEFDFFLTAATNLRPAPDSVITGSGLMIYHVDEAALRRALETGRYPNDDKTWKGVDIEEADHVQDLDSPVGAFAYGSFYDSFRRGNNDRFGPDTNPSSADDAGASTGIEVDEISPAGHFMTFRTRLSPVMDFERGEFPADISRLSPIAVQLPGSVGNHERLLLAADSASIYLADAGLAAWDGTVEKLPIANGGAWTSSPVVSQLFPSSGGEMYITSAGGILHAYDFSGASMPIDDDGTPGTLKLRGDAALVLIVGPDDQIFAFSSTADSTYLLILAEDGTSPGTGWVRRGPIGFEIGLMKEQIVSHPATGIIKPDEETQIFGEYIATYDVDRGLCFNFIPVNARQVQMPWDRAISIDPVDVITKAAGIFKKPNALLTIAAGDIDGDGSDEMVAAIDGEGLFYFTAGGAVRSVRMQGSRYSPPVLSDIDGDGTLETALRDESRCLLFSGFGVPVSGWPRALDETVIGHEDLVSVPPSVVGDVDDDGAREILFLIAGDIHSYDFSGREAGDWPLAGEGARGGSLTLLWGEGDRLYIVDCAAAIPYAASGGTGAVSGAISTIRRYDPGVEVSVGRQMWRMYRHDAGGSARQENGTPENPRTERVDPATFIVYPNPATGSSFTARILVSAPARVKVTIFNIEGEKVVERTRDHSWFAGSAVPFEESFSTAAFSGGVYICRIEVAGAGWSWTGAKKFAVIR
ncbi:MAG: T9SS type A sorting domain-containing protein [Candidatus Krumholzibacteriia bacterium]